MRLFADTADISEIRELAATGLLNGVTTNPSLIAKTGRPFDEVIREICDAVDGPVSAEVTATDFEGMVVQGKKLAAIAKNAAVKVPSTWDGFRACRGLRHADRQVNVTLCFSANQALLAAKAGATFNSPFAGRLDDIGFDGMDVIREIRAISTATSRSIPKFLPHRSARLSTSSRQRWVAPTPPLYRRECSETSPSIPSPTRAWNPSSQTGRKPGRPSDEWARQPLFTQGRPSTSVR